MTKRLSYALPIAALVLLAADPAFAQSTGGGAGNLTTFLQNVLNMLTGTLGTTMSVLAICATAIGLAFGMVRPHSFFAVIFAIAILFSSKWMVDQITGGGF